MSAQSYRSNLENFVSSDSRYSPRMVFKEVSRATKPIIQYDPISLWEQDTASLPQPLADYRRQMRAFAKKHLEPIALNVDASDLLEPGACCDQIETLLITAAHNGMFSDMLPSPIGSVPLSRYRYSLSWQQSIKVEELARSCGGLMLLLSAHNLGIAPLLMSGDLRAFRKFALPALKENKNGDPHLFAYAITEPSAGSDVEEGHGASLYKPGTTARKVKDGWVINGRKCFISGGDIAKSITTFAALEGEGISSWTCFLVKRDMPGFSVARKEMKMGMRASGAAELEFNEVFVPDDHVIGGLRKGWAINRSILNLSRFPVAAMAVGFAQAAVDIVLDFVCQYEVSGKKLINYQETQLAVADMIAETSAIRAMVWSSSQSWVSTQRKSALCKFHASDRAIQVVTKGMELMGCHGGVHTNKIEKVFRDARLTQIFEGTNQINRLAVIEDIQEQLLESINKR